MEVLRESGSKVSNSNNNHNICADKSDTSKSGENKKRKGEFKKPRRVRRPPGKGNEKKDELR